MSHGAGCLCGAVRMTIAAEPMAARQCWCRLCQYLGGGSQTVNVCFPAEAVSIEGDIRYHHVTADSGNAMTRGFCPTCGTPLTSAADSRPHLLFIRAGALDDPSLIGPQATIWTSAAPIWARIDPDLPSYPAQIPPVAWAASIGCPQRGSGSLVTRKLLPQCSIVSRPVAMSYRPQAILTGLSSTAISPPPTYERRISRPGFVDVPLASTSLNAKASRRWFTSRAAYSYVRFQRPSGPTQGSASSSASRRSTRAIGGAGPIRRGTGGLAARTDPVAASASKAAAGSLPRVAGEPADQAGEHAQADAVARPTFSETRCHLPDSCLPPTGSDH